MLYADPPYHTRLRALVSRAFTPRVVAKMEPHIEQVVDGLLDAVQDKGRMDVIEHLAYPLPVTVIMELLGLPVDERERFKKWSDDFMATLGVVRSDPGELSRGLSEPRRAHRVHPRDSARACGQPQGRLAERLGDRGGERGSPRQR